MKYLFTILMALVIVAGASAFGGEYEKSPPVRTEVLLSDISNDVIASAIDADIVQEGDNQSTDNTLKFDAVIPYNQIKIASAVVQRVRWCSSSLFYTSIKTIPARDNRISYDSNRCCLELNC